jgi:hypothetical protein
MARHTMSSGSARKLILSTIEALRGDEGVRAAESPVDALFALARQHADMSGKPSDRIEIVAVTVTEIDRGEGGGRETNTALGVAARETGDDIPEGSWPFPFSGRICIPIPFVDDDGEISFIIVCLVWWFP